VLAYLLPRILVKQSAELSGSESLDITLDVVTELWQRIELTVNAKSSTIVGDSSTRTFPVEPDGPYQGATLLSRSRS